MDEKKRLEKRTNNKLYPAVYEAEFVMLAQAGGCWDTPGKVGEHKTRFKDYQLKITLLNSPSTCVGRSITKIRDKKRRTKLSYLHRNERLQLSEKFHGKF